MAGRGMDEAGAGVGGDVLAGQQRHIEVIALAAERMRRRSGRAASTSRNTLQHRSWRAWPPARPAHRPAASFSPTCAKRPFARVGNLIKRRKSCPAKRRWRDCRESSRAWSSRCTMLACANVAVRRLHQRKLHIDRRRCFSVILDFGFGQRGLLHRRPHHRAEAAIEQPVRRRICAARARSPLRRDSSSWCRDAPIADAAQPLELLALHVDPVRAKSRQSRRS